MDAGKNGDFDIATPISLQRFHKSNHRSHPSYFELNTYDVTSDVSQIRERKTAPSPINPHPKPPPNPLQQRTITHHRNKERPDFPRQESAQRLRAVLLLGARRKTHGPVSRARRARAPGVRPIYAERRVAGAEGARPAPARGRIGRGANARATRRDHAMGRRRRDWRRNPCARFFVVVFWSSFWVERGLRARAHLLEATSSFPWVFTGMPLTKISLCFGAPLEADKPAPRHHKENGECFQLASTMDFAKPRPGQFSKRKL